MIMKKCLRSVLWLGLLGAMLLPTQVLATEVSFQSDTILRGFQRDTATATDAGVVPVYEYLQVDADTPDEPGLSFHLYGWGRWDLADNGYYEDATAGELLYGYLEYTRDVANFNARFGRQMIFEGGNETIDGLRLSSDLGKFLSGSVFVGQQVAMASENSRGGDIIYGGRLAHHLAGRYDLGVFYQKLRNDSEDAGEDTGIDVSVYLPAGMTFSGLSSYNIDADDWAEHSYSLSAKIGVVTLRPFFQRFQYDAYFDSGVNSANPFRFLEGTGEVLTTYGADFTLSAADSVTLVGKVKLYDYDLLSDNSQYYSAQATWVVSEATELGGELGYMSSDVAQNDYLLSRVFAYWKKSSSACPVDFVSADLVYVSYDQKIYDDDNSLFVSLGMGKKLFDDALELKLSADYSDDPYFDSDLRGMLTASYRFGQSL